MALLRPFGRLRITRRGHGLPVAPQTQSCFRRRGFASVGKAPEVDKLPLSGLRVLDMTRVLAGVRLNHENEEFVLPDVAC
jgi:hypothetical protein